MFILNTKKIYFTCKIYEILLYVQENNAQNLERGKHRCRESKMGIKAERNAKQILKKKMNFTKLILLQMMKNQVF